MSEQRCQNCARASEKQHPSGTGVSREVVDALLEEMQQLRQTIAMLRGMGAGRTVRTSGTDHAEEPTQVGA